MFKTLSYFLLLTLCLFFVGCNSEKQAPQPKPPFSMVTAENLFAVDVLDQDHVWMVGFNSAIVHSPDGGASWDMQKSGVTVPLCDVSFVSPQKGWIAGRVGTILRTEDGGKTWEAQSSGTNRNLFGLYFVDELFGWAVGEFGTILHTSDGGKTWVNQGSGEDRIYNDVCFVDRQNGWVAGEYGLIYHTQDGGTNWELQVCQDIIPVVDETEWETPTPSLYSIWFSDSLNGWASGMDSITITTEDGGNNWKKVNNPLEDEKITLFKIAAINQSVWAVGQRGNYIFSEDRGSSWKHPEDATNTKFWLRDMDFSDALVGWAVGSRGTMIKTEDGGRTWKMFSGIPLSSIQ
jgi:photosystem II stability/assembly factor-like uncharacterized protein